MKTKLFLLSVLFTAFALAGCDADTPADEQPDGDKTENPDKPGDKNDDDDDDPKHDSPSPENDVIYYTTFDGKVIEFYDGEEADEYGNPFGKGVNLTDNVYKDGKGMLIFDKDVTEIGTYAFYNCNNLTSITIPESVTVIGMNPFMICVELTAFYGKFASEDNRCLIVDGRLASFASNGLTSYAVPASVTEIGVQAFSFCASLESVALHDGITKIGGEAFYGCYGLKTINFPDSVTEIDEGAFCECNALESVTLPVNLHRVESRLFLACENLASVTIPESVTEIRGDSFAWCGNLTSVYCKAVNPPSMESSSSAFDGNAEGRKIYVPKGSVEKYKAAEGWNEYASDIVGF